MSDRDLSVKLRIDGDAKSGQAALDATEKGLDKVSNAGQKTKSSTDALNDAFGKLGIRSARQIETDILEVNQALLNLAKRTDLSGEEFDRAFVAGQARIKQLRAELNGASGDVEQVGKRADGMLGMMGKLGLAFSGAELARQFIMVNVELESMERTFRAITGSSEAAAREMDYVRDVADRLGLPIVTAGKAYADLSAATKGTAAEGRATRDVFEAVAHAMSVAGKSSDDTQGALLALSQMASKGVVAMEELRGQLGERLPGALNAVAQGFGITTQQLIALVESGQLTAEELFPALANGLNKLYGAAGENAEQTSTLAQTWDRFKNAIADAFKTAGDAGAISALKVALEGLSTVVTVVSVGLVATGKDMGIFLAALASGDIGIHGFSDRAKQAFAEVEQEARDKLVKAAMHNDVLAATLDDAGKKALSSAKAHAQAASEIEKSGAAAAGASSNITRLNVTYGELKKSADQATKAAEAHADATKEQGAASMALANAFGTEEEKRRAKVAATQADAEALQAVAQAKRNELSVARDQLSAIEVEIGARGKTSDAQAKQIDELKKLIAARETEADKAGDQARSAAIAAAQADVEAQSQGNNAARVVELAAAYTEAKAAAEALHAQKAAGLEVGAESEAADIRAAAAAKLYRDALADKRAEIQQSLSVAQANLSVDQAGIRLAIEQQRTLLEVARARGDERGAISAVLEMKRLEIQLAELTAKAKRAEAEAILQTVQIRREELRAAGELTAAKEAELKAQEAAAKVKQTEAEIAGETAKRMRELAEASRDAGDATGRFGGGARDAADDLDRMAGSAGRATRAVKELLSERRRGSSGGDLSYEDMKSLGMSDSEISDTLSSRQMSAAEGAQGIVKRGVSSQSIDHKQLAARQGLFGKDADVFSQLLEETMAREMEMLRSKGQMNLVESSQSYITSFAGSFNRAVALAAQGTRKAASESRRTVEIKLPGGRGGSVDLASDSDAEALTGILGQLESAAARSSGRRLI